MGDMESFGGFDSGGESHDPASFERFKQRMKAASQQIQAQQKQEKKQKKSEDELVKILAKFIRGGASNEIMQLVTRLLENNTPAGFVLSLLLISHPEIQREMGVLLLEEPKNKGEATVGGLPDGISEDISKNHPKGIQASADRRANPSIDETPKGLMTAFQASAKYSYAVSNWINEIARRVAENPHKTIKTVMDHENKVNHTCIQLASFCLRDFMAGNTSNKKSEFSQIKEFVSVFLNEILQTQAKMLNNTKELNEGDS